MGRKSGRRDCPCRRVDGHGTQSRAVGRTSRTPWALAGVEGDGLNGPGPRKGGRDWMGRRAAPLQVPEPLTYRITRCSAPGPRWDHPRRPTSGCPSHPLILHPSMSVGCLRCLQRLLLRRCAARVQRAAPFSAKGPASQPPASRVVRTESQSTGPCTQPCGPPRQSWEMVLGASGGGVCHGSSIVGPSVWSEARFAGACVSCLTPCSALSPSPSPLPSAFGPRIDTRGCRGLSLVLSVMQRDTNNHVNIVMDEMTGCLLCSLSARMPSTPILAGRLVPCFFQVWSGTARPGR